jgi:Ras-related protein Rab-21
MTADLVIHVVGNKIDLASERKVPFQKVLDYCETHHQVNGVHEVSAKDNNGIFFFINIYIYIYLRFSFSLS